MKSIATALLPLVLVGCAIEGIGWQGHVDAYNNAAAAGQEYAALNRGTRDPAWYAGWCAAIEPHFARMGDVHERIERYCQAMQVQPQNAEAIQRDLTETLATGRAAATGSRNAANAAARAYLQSQPQPLVSPQPIHVAPVQNKSVHCTSSTFGLYTNTDCQSSY